MKQIFEKLFDILMNSELKIVENHYFLYEESTKSKINHLRVIRSEEGKKSVPFFILIVL